jgi:uncharacterized Rmd1/YagE family protein
MSSSTVEVFAYGFASTFRLRELAKIVGGNARVEKDRLLASPVPGSYLVAYDFGSLVFVGVSEAERRAEVDKIAKRLTGEPHAPLTETFTIEVEPGAPLEVRFDRVILPELSLPAVEIVAEVIAQSVAMDYYADDVAEIEAEMGRITAQLRSAGRIPRRVRSTLRFVGACITTRSDIITTLALFDKPDATWENEQLDRLWNELRHNLELDDRYRLLDAKLRLFQDNLVLLVDLARQRHTLALELLVAFLILLEMLIMVWQVLTTRHG